MADPTNNRDAGEIVVAQAAPTTPTRPTRSVRPSVKAKEAGWVDEMSPTQKGRKRTTRAIRAPPVDTDIEHAKNAQKGHTDGETGKTLLLRVLEELRDLKDASKKQGELITHLHGQLSNSQQELRETKDELKTVREELEALNATIALSQASPRASYADVAPTPPDSNPSNVRPLSSFRTGPSDWTDTLYCTIDVSCADKAENDSAAPGTVRSLIETEVRAELGQSNWRCQAVTRDQKNGHRIKIACRNEEEHPLVKRVAEAKALVLRSCWLSPLGLRAKNG